MQPQIQYQASHHYSNLRLAEHFDVVLNLVPLSMRQHFNFCSSVKVGTLYLLETKRYKNKSYYYEMILLK